MKKKFSQGMKIALKQKLSQSQVRLPLNLLIQTQKIIQLNTLDLVDNIHHSLNENPFLEEVEPSENNITEDDFNNVKSNDFLEWDTISSSNSAGIKQEQKSKSEIMERVVSNPKPSLTSTLLQQASFFFNRKDELEMAETIIAYLEPNGFLSKDSLKEISLKSAYPLKKIRNIHDFIKNNFEPIGIASATIQEALILQLLRKGKPQDDLTIELIKNYFDFLSKSNLNEIKKKLSRSLQEIQTAINEINRLEPDITREFVDQKNFQIIPDVFIKERSGELEIILNKEIIPQIRINPNYSQLSTQLEKSSNQNINNIKSYLSEKKNEASNLLYAIEYRESNLFKVMKTLVIEQKDFFLNGFANLKPYKIIDLAKKLEIDNGTLSRLINQKYIATRWGIFLLRKMFSIQIYIDKKQQIVSAKSVEEKIKEIIKQFPEKKLSDQKIANILKEMGLVVARRTVNKYRQNLSIPSSLERGK